MSNSIIIKGAREHNLKNLDVEIPRDKLVVMTGLSGSGKSSLAFDTIYAEGQRRYVESLSAYARQFLEQMGKPDVDSIEGLSPAISIEQKSTSHNPRSTVGTVTEIYDYLRLLYARVGHPYCFQCGQEITAQTVQQMVDAICELPEGTKFQILSPIVRGRKGEYRKELLEMRKAGYVRARINGEIVDLGEDITLDKQKKHNIEIVVDRLVMKPGDALMRRVADSVETSMKLAGGLVGVLSETGKVHLYSEKLACIKCGVSYPEITPRIFSFNSPHGACPACDGIGYAMTPGASEEEDFTLLERCETCDGARLKPESLAVKIAKKSIAEVTMLSVRAAADFFTSLKFTERELVIAHRILKEIRERLGFLVNVGLDYLTLDRPAATLSGGEGQRIRLATQIGSGLVGVLYILDEPSIGLHQRDNDRLLATLKRLRDLGNTVIVVEHDEDAIRLADYVVDMGPGAGIHGGTVVAEGPLERILQNPNSLTGQYLTGFKQVRLPAVRRKADMKRALRVVRASGNNLKDVTAEFPLGTFTCITGVSGGGKSTLVIDTLYKAASRKLNGARENPSPHAKIEGLENLDKIIEIDQSPIGRTPRSNPATYTGAFTPIRDWFAGLPEAKARGYGPGRFSFNVKGGRCEACEGDGVIKIEMHFLPDVYVQCDVCKGHRYNRETLEVKFKDKSIADILDMTVEDAAQFFKAVPSVRDKMETLERVGLGYIKVGQQATTLSGGEAQRIKLSKELSRRATGRTLYILDEPTTGLHFEDVRKLLEVLHELADQGNTVIVIEHNLEVIKTADWIIDLGPEGGDGGGEIVAAGTPEDVVAEPRSYTGQFLKPLLKRRAASVPAPTIAKPAKAKKSARG